MTVGRYPVPAYGAERKRREGLYLWKFAGGPRGEKADGVGSCSSWVPLTMSSMACRMSPLHLKAKMRTYCTVK